jgi:hypothetical protein
MGRVMPPGGIMLGHIEGKAELHTMQVLHCEGNAERHTVQDCICNQWLTKDTYTL